MNQASPATPQDIVAADALDLSQWIRLRRVSCREVMTAFLDHIARVNTPANAIVSLRDRAVLLMEAGERDAQLARGEYLGWLHGIPQAPKDLTATAGIASTQGSPIFRDEVPKADALVAARMRAQGAIFIGKTNSPEFGLGSNTYNTVFGATLNAYDATRSAGGSSGGTAVALALRMLPVADGSDMMGSLRNPAGWNNVFGFRPSQGRVPSVPAVDLYYNQLGCAGPMGRSVPDLAMLLSTQAGYDARAPLSIAQDAAQFAQPLARDFGGARIGWLGDYNGYLAMEDGVLALCETALEDFGAIGCTVEAARTDYPLEKLWDCWRTLRHFSVAGSLGALYRDPAKRALLKPEAQWEVEGGLALSGEDVWNASVARSQWYNALLALFEHYDYLALPSAQLFPFDAKLHWPSSVAGREMDTYHRWMEVVIGASLAGLPVISVPAGFNVQGLPMGLQVIGKPQADLSVLQIAHAYDQATQWVKRRVPSILAA
ncbi:amidase [Paraburkholderia bannensis]|uniref:Amidase n=1 Tax=Paraburkholderia bannensis TaxID=765414 RepID=A0A7W9WWG4_9BURK|nr:MULTISPECIES: amidase [Paraburkholderia]MBB3260921.1 amidase [Paraburkholderia sp. WP4_3_2]MBB6105958.1 amidase [Paraburkholderia bannensis]